MANKFERRRRTLREARNQPENPYASQSHGRRAQSAAAAPPPPQLGKLAWPRDAILSAGLVLLIAVAYAPLPGNGFINYDDDGYVVENEYVNQGLTVHGVVWAMTEIREANWHPLTWLSHMLDCQLFGMERAAGHHLVNLGLHMVNSLLLYYVLLRMSRSAWPSVVVAALFAVHPLHVESVAWVAERKDVLSTMFGLIAVAGWLNYVARPGVGRYALVVLAFAASLMSKAMLVTLPLVLLLLDYWPLGRAGSREQGAGSREQGVSRRNPLGAAPPPALSSLLPAPRSLLLEKLPLMLMSATVCIVTLFAQLRGHAVVPLGQHSLPARFATVVHAYCGYLVKTAVPVRLAPIYPLQKTIHYPAVTACAIALMIVTALVWAGRVHRYLAVGWLWYLVTLVPVIGIVQVGMQSMADRYTYLPLVGIFMLAAWSGAEAAGRWPWLKWLLAGLTMAAVIACCLLTLAQARLWASTETLFAHTAAVTEENSVALTNLGLVAIQKDDYAEAERQLREALRIDPRNIDVHGNLASLYVKRKNYDAAIREYAEINRLCPQNAKAYSQLAHALELQGNLADAELWLRRAIEMEPASVSMHKGLGLIQQMQGEAAEALENYAVVRRFRPGDVEVTNNMAWIYATHPQDQLRDGAKAVDLLLPLAAKAGENANLLDTLAAAYAETGRFEEALQTVETATDQARSDGKPPQTIADFQQRAALYRRRQPYRDPQLLPKGK